MKARILKPVILSFFLLLSFAAIAQTLKPEEFEKLIKDSGVQILDVRTAGEYKSGHLKNSLQADWNDEKQFAERTRHLDKNAPVYIYCLGGSRSTAAADWLEKKGYNKVYSLKGGVNAWKMAGKTLEAAVTAKQTTLTAYKDALKTGIVLVDFGATWCPPCRKMEPVLTQLQKNKGGQYTLLKMDAGVESDLMKELTVSELPTFIVYKNGVETWRKSGIISLEELEAAIKK